MFLSQAEVNNVNEVKADQTPDRGISARALYDYQAGGFSIALFFIQVINIFVELEKTSQRLFLIIDTFFRINVASKNAKLLVTND